VQVLDQHVGAARAVAQQGLHFGQRNGIDAPTLRGFTLAQAGRALHFDGDDNLAHTVSCIRTFFKAARTRLIGLASI
jgi:hypothetical protein